MVFATVLFVRSGVDTIDERQAMFSTCRLYPSVVKVRETLVVIIHHVSILDGLTLLHYEKFNN
jgi:hypothetical protein